MRRSLLLLVVLVSGILAHPSPAHGMTLRGTAAGERIWGTPSKDTIKTGGGTDLVLAGAGNDSIKVTGEDGALVFGGPGKDTYVSALTSDGSMLVFDDDGTPGDEVTGGPGGDQILVLDGAKDIVDCGKGFDTAYLDTVDVARRCETTIRTDLGTAIDVGTNGTDIFPTPPAGQSKGFFGLNGGDTMSGNDTSNTFLPGGGIDNVTGGIGTDTVIDSDASADVINTGDGNDSVFGADGSSGDAIDCGPGALDVVLIFLGDTPPMNCETIHSGLGSVQVIV